MNRNNAHVSTFDEHARAQGHVASTQVQRHDALQGTLRSIANLLFGVGMGIGLPLANMTSPKANSHFFDLSLWSSSSSRSAFAFDLPIVFGAALVIHGILFWGVVKNVMKKPILGENFHIPANNTINMDLIGGAALFGAGWVLSGYCPGPLVAASFSGQIYPVFAASFMFLGFGAVYFWRAFKQYSSHHDGGWNGLLTAVGQHGTLEYAVAVAAILSINFLSAGVVIEPTTLSFLQKTTSPAILRVIGGSIIGTTIALMMIINGQVLGLSGILGGLVNPLAKDKWIRFLFVLGSGVGSLLAQRLLGVDMAVSAAPTFLTALGGIMVGIGSALSTGCTSGHGICGVTRFSPRSIVATGTFFLTALATATFFRTSRIFF